MNANTSQDLRYQPLYTLADISRYARVPPATLRTWILGGADALLPATDRRGIAPFSFMNLIEAHVLVALRKAHRVPMRPIRRAVRWLSRRFDTPHPLAELNLETDGYNLFVVHLGIPVVASSGGQIAIPQVVSRYLRRIERDLQAAPVRFYPFTTYETCPKLIVMDPRVDFGRPVIKGTRIETLMIFERYSGGEALRAIARDYDLKLRQVEEALRCEIVRRAA